MTFNEPVSRQQLKSFSRIISTAIVLFLGILLPFLMNTSYPAWPWLVGLVFLLIGECWPLSLKTAYQLWIQLGNLLNKIVSPILMAVVFFGLVFPTGILKRLAGKLKIQKSIDSEASSYRSPPGLSNNMEDPF